jgi:hypothetical protein
MNVTGILERFGNNTWWSSWFEPIQVSNLTQVKVGRYLDLQERVVILYDAVVAADVFRESLRLEDVPPNINIFSLLNLRIPGNVTDLENWKVIFSKNSSTYSNISSMLEVSAMRK